MNRRNWILGTFAAVGGAIGFRKLPQLKLPAWKYGKPPKQTGRIDSVCERWPPDDYVRLFSVFGCEDLSGLEVMNCRLLPALGSEHPKCRGTFMHYSKVERIGVGMFIVECRYEAGKTAQTA